MVVVEYLEICIASVKIVEILKLDHCGSLEKRTKLNKI